MYIYIFGTLCCVNASVHFCLTAVYKEMFGTVNTWELRSVSWQALLSLVEVHAMPAAKKEHICLRCGWKQGEVHAPLQSLYLYAERIVGSTCSIYRAALS